MFSYFRNRKAQSIKKENERIAKSKEAAEKRLRDSTGHMLNSWCPIFDGNCQKRCIHFSEGHIFDWDWNQKDYYTRSSVCKLWV